MEKLSAARRRPCTKRPREGAQTRARRIEALAPRHPTDSDGGEHGVGPFGSEGDVDVPFGERRLAHLHSLAPEISRVQRARRWGICPWSHGAFARGAGWWCDNTRIPGTGRPILQLGLYDWAAVKWRVYSDIVCCGSLRKRRERPRAPAVSSTMNPAAVRRSACGYAGAASIGFIGSSHILEAGSR